MTARQLAVDTTGWRAGDLIAAVVAAEAGGFEEIVLSAAAPGRPDPIVVLAAAATRTTAIGLTAQIDTSDDHPYAFARRLIALHKISRGRAGWYPVDTIAQRRDEFIDITRRLWGSWEPGVLVADRVAGVYVDTDRVHNVDVDGRYFSVHSPLDVGEGPYGKPSLLEPDAPLEFGGVAALGEFARVGQ
jgi:alkanesulfonate monooxygenase SsuD/methylene tetrahydromethanopterin reductase-like flavin-dependent oxidoreductase (luciferase family)